MSATVYFTITQKTKLNMDRRYNDQTTRKKKLRNRFCR